MEQRITVNGKTYIVPAQAIGGLVQWLQLNAVDASQAVEPVHEVAPNTPDQRDLLLEDVATAAGQIRNQFDI